MIKDRFNKSDLYRNYAFYHYDMMSTYMKQWQLTVSCEKAIVN